MTAEQVPVTEVAVTVGALTVAFTELVPEQLEMDMVALLLMT